MAEAIEEKAKSMGYVSKEEWKGDPEKWRPIEEFVERGENILPIVKAQAKKEMEGYRKELDELKSELNITIAANKREAQEAELRGYEKAKLEYTMKVSELDEKEADAIIEQDKDAILRIKKEKNNLKEPEKPKPVAETKQTNPEFEEWSKKEKWYGDDSELTKAADIQGQVLLKQYPDKPLSEIYKMTADNVKKLHPEKFENPRRKDPGYVEEGENGPVDTKNQTFNSLPASAKESYKRMKEKFLLKNRKYTKEQYATDWYNQ